MRTIALCSIALTAAVAATPAQAKPTKPAKADKAAAAQAKRCAPRAVGYHARGVLVSSRLTQTAGALTPERGDDRYSGPLTVLVAKANHRAPKGSQSYTVENARLKLRDADGDGTADTPKAGDRVTVSGRITKVSRRCAQPTAAPVVTVRRIDVKAAKAVAPTA